MVRDAVDALKEDGPGVIQGDLQDWKIVDGIVHYKDKIYIPADADLRRQIVYNHHNLSVMGHPGVQKTKELVSRDY